MKASTVNKISFVRAIISFSSVLIFGIVFLTLFLKFGQNDIPENYIETEAEIIRIEEELSPSYDASDGLGAEDYDHYVFVKYSYGGNTYSDCEYGNYSSSMKEGDTVLLYVNPDEPSEFISDPSGNFVFAIVGVAVILIGAIGIGYNIYKRKKGEA